LLIFSRIYPGVQAANIPLGGKTHEEALILLSQYAVLPKNITLTLKDQTFSLKTDTFAKVDIEATSKKALSLKNLKRQTIPLEISLDNTELIRQIDEIAKNSENPPQEPAIMFKNSQLEVFPGTDGETINTGLLKNLILINLSSLSQSTIHIPIIKTSITLNSDQVTKAQERSKKILNKTLILKYEKRTFSYKDADLLPLLNPQNGYKENLINSLSIEVSKSLDRPPQDPRLTFSNGKVEEFQPALDGIKTNTNNLALQITDSIKKLEQEDVQSIETEIPVSLTPPKLQTKDINNLGLEKLIGEGISYFRGSIASRIHNISLAASRVNGTLVKPGETFSFNATVGDISKDTGFQEAYIIKEGRTILGDGGGVCQVSTTLFRAVMNTGLPVLERRAHAYRVGYYEQGFPPGLDATVYSPTTDFKFKNDTPAHILIQTYVDKKNSKLIFDLYGTDDGRVSMVGKSVITEQTPPPEDIYQDDPSLPVGTTKQVDYKSWGKVNSSIPSPETAKQFLPKLSIAITNPGPQSISSAGPNDNPGH
jgi:vancomycin resistance protein YoaR